MTVQTILKDLRDIPGVTGSFILSAEGEPRLRDLPAVVPDEALSEVGPRVARLLEAARQQNDVTQCSLRFTEHRMYLRPAGPWVLCVLSDRSVNVPTLQMGMTLVTRRIATMDFSAPAVEPATAPSPVPLAPTPAPTTNRAQVYRGRRVE